jgi:hypothetical protein
MLCTACTPLPLPQFPYYTFIDRSKVYSIGSLFYAIYFFVSFPMFMRLDEQVAGQRWNLREVSFFLTYINCVCAECSPHSALT